MSKFRTNDEIIAVFFEYLVKLPEPEYANVCRQMESEGPAPELMGKMICESEKKRSKNAEVHTSIS